jgi:hypothetical protein
MQNMPHFPAIAALITASEPGYARIETSRSASQRPQAAPVLRARPRTPLMLAGWLLTLTERWKKTRASILPWGFENA